MLMFSEIFFYILFFLLSTVLRGVRFIDSNNSTLAIGYTVQVLRLLGHKWFQEGWEWRVLVEVRRLEGRFVVSSSG